MELDPTEFNDFLNDIGQDVLWRRASICPCRDLISGAPRQGCPLCGARGVIWDQAVPAVVGLTSMRVKREWASFGTWESGDVAMSIPSDSPLYACGEKDRVVMSDSSEPFQSVLVRDEQDQVRYPIVSIDRAFWLDPTGATIVEGPIPAFSDVGAIVWDEGSGPPIGTEYSLRGRKHQEYYMVDDLPQDRAHFHGNALPRVVHMRRFDLFGRVAGDS